jgi:hypothetical protein
MIAAIAVGVVMVLVIAVLVGFRIGQAVLTGTPSSAVSTAAASSPVAAPTTTPTVESAPTESPEPEPVITSAAPTVPRPTFVPVTPAVPATQTPLPEVSFAEVQPLPAAPPIEAPEELPPAPPSPTPEPTCPADNGVTATILKAELVREGGSLDSYKLTLELNNRIAVPVWMVGIFNFTDVRANGVEFPPDSFVLTELDELPPGRSTVTTRQYAVTTVNGYGSPTTTFKLSGDVRVDYIVPGELGYPRYCEFKDVTYGKPLQGEWGS